MKKPLFALNTFELIGLAVGVLGFIFFLTGPFASLTFAGHMALAIFWLAAWLYVSEPIPVYATSLLVMLLASVMLSKEGPIYKYEAPQTITVTADSLNRFAVPQTALFNKTKILVEEKGKWSEVEIMLVEANEKEVWVQPKTTIKSVTIAKNAYGVASGYAPLSYKGIFGTLADPIIILFLGGFMLARAAVKYRLDTALTATLLKPFGSKPGAILFGLILVTAILSAFMSNTATTAMMMTVILPILSAMPPKEKFKTAIVLSIPIAANIGGIATPIGTPPNAIVVSALAKQNILMPFSDWVVMAAPYTIVMLVLAWFLLQVLYKPETKSIDLDLKAKFSKDPKAIAVYAVFIVTIGLWFTESSHGIPSGMVAFIPVVFLTFGNILDTKDIQSLSWEVLWLVAGGMALGSILDKAGVALWLINSIEWTAFSITVIFLVFAVVGWLLANFMSHTVTATLIMPLGISLSLTGSLGNDYSMTLTCMVIGIATSIAMILPISTPPNAIAMSTGMVSTKEMAKFGVIIGILGIPIMIAFALFYWNLFV